MIKSLTEKKEKRGELDGRASAILFYLHTHKFYTMHEREKKCDHNALVALVMRRLLIRRMDLETADTYVYELTEKGYEASTKEVAKSGGNCPSLTALAA